MLHNKYFEALSMFTGDYQREIYGRELIGKVSMSQKNIALTLEELENQSVLKSRKEGTLRHYSLNLGHTEIKDIISMVELMKKIRFMAKQRKMAHIFRHDARIVGIFGSYAKGTQKEDSDIDLFVIGSKSGDDYEAKGKALDLDISVKYFAPPEWARLLREKNSLCREIIGNHIIIFGAESFINSLWGNFYGFS